MHDLLDRLQVIKSSIPHPRHSPRFSSHCRFQTKMLTLILYSVPDIVILCKYDCESLTIDPILPKEKQKKQIELLLNTTLSTV